MLLAHELGCERGERLLFKKLGFELNAGEALLVRGGNGRGKTSLLRILCGLSEPCAGVVSWRGEPVNGGNETYRREMAYLAHANGIKDELTPLENLRLSAALNGRRLEEDAAAKALAQLGLARCLDLPARLLSFGQRRRVALAALLTAGAVLWILDEPLTGLDAGGVALVEQMIREHVATGGMAIATTHQPLALNGLPQQTVTVGD